MDAEKKKKESKRKDKTININEGHKEETMNQTADRNKKDANKQQIMWS